MAFLKRFSCIHQQQNVLHINIYICLCGVLVTLVIHGYVSIMCIADAQNEIINSLWHNGAIWWHQSGSEFAQVMACCLPATNHYLDQGWMDLSRDQWHSPEGNSTASTEALIQYNEFENYTKLLLHLPGVNELMAPPIDAIIDLFSSGPSCTSVAVPSVGLYLQMNRY